MVDRVWPNILRALAQGAIIKTMCADFGVTPTILRAYRECVPGAQAQWESAREQSADAFMDEALDVARTPNSTQVEASDARTRIDTLKWAARIRNPRLYSDRTQVDMTVKTVDLTAIITAANLRLAAARQGTLIDGESSRVADPAALPGLEDLL